MFSNTDRGVFPNGGGTWQGPGSCKGHPDQQPQQTGAYRTGKEPAQSHAGDGGQVLLFVHQHDGEKNQNVDGTDIDQNLGRCDETGI